MAIISESGHTKNVTNLESLITAIKTYGASYNPSKASIKIPALQALLTAANESVNELNDAQSVYSNAVAGREYAFQPFAKLITRTGNSLKATDAIAQVNDSANTIIRKLQGRRAGAKLTDEEIKTLQAEGKEVNQISVSQMGYDTRLFNFDKLISLLKTVPEYNPNEEELKTDSLKQYHTDLKAKNDNVVTASSQLGLARNNRNEILYKPLTGLVDVASDAKTYVKSVFGASSPQYRQISRLSFKQRTI